METDVTTNVTTLTIDEFIKTLPVMTLAGRSRAEWEPSENEIIETAQEMLQKGYQPFFKETFKKLAVWLTRYKKHKYHGLLLSGNTGTGKTEFVKKCLPELVFYPKANHPDRKFFIAKAFVNAWKRHDGIIDSDYWGTLLGSANSADSYHFMIDDLGQEPTGHAFGVVSEVMDEIICQRYLDWEKTGTITIITTNLSVENLRKRYGDRTFDRLKAMCDLIEFKGDSLRGRK